MVKAKLTRKKRPVPAPQRRFPPPSVRFAICSWINDQFETASLPQLTDPPTIAQCAVWTCPAESELVGVTYLAGRTAYYSSSNGVNNTAWWRIGVVPKSVLP
jgi:hypothetical protein